MNSGDAIRAVRADDREVSHANLARTAFFHQADAFDAPFIARKADANLIEQPAVDLVNDLQLPGKKGCEPLYRPLLECFRQQSVVGVSQRLFRQLPRQVPFQMRIIEQDTHQFSDRHRRVCVIELDRCLLGQLFPIRVVAQEPAHQIGQRTRDQEVFLHKSQLLSGGGGVVGIQHASQGLRFQCPAQCAYKVAGAEFLKIEVIGRSRGPEPKSVDGLSTVANHGTIVRYAEQAGWPVRNDLNTSVPQFEGTVELDFHFLVRAGDLPRIAVA